MNDQISTIRAFVTGIVAGASIGIVAGCATAKASSSCEEDPVGLDNPIVTVIDGPGDAAAEQARWPDGEAYWQGELIIPPVVVSLERVE